MSTSFELYYPEIFDVDYRNEVSWEEADEATGYNLSTPKEVNDERG